MSLDYNTKAIAERPEQVDENGYWVPEFHSVCFATIFLGMPKLTASNLQEFYRRYLLNCYAYGQTPYLTLEKISWFVGLATNASPKTVTEFNKDTLAIMQRRALEAINAEKEA